jgi:hypothetical protein
MSEPAEQFEDFSDYTESPLPGPLERSPRDTSERSTGSDFQEMLKSAISNTEFTDTYSPSGLPLRRQGKQLHINYDQAMQFLWE